MNKGKGKAAAAPLPTPYAPPPLPEKIYCSMGSGCLHGIAVALQKRGTGLIKGRQFKIRTILQQPAAWLPCGHVCCWEPVPGSKLPEDANTCAKIHDKECCDSCTSTKRSYKAYMMQAVAEGKLSADCLALAGVSEVSMHAHVWSTLAPTHTVRNVGGARWWRMGIA